MDAYYFVKSEAFLKKKITQSGEFNFIATFNKNY